MKILIRVVKALVLTAIILAVALFVLSLVMRFRSWNNEVYTYAVTGELIREGVTSSRRLYGQKLYVGDTGIYVGIHPSNYERRNYAKGPYRFVIGSNGDITEVNSMVLERMMILSSSGKEYVDNNIQYPYSAPYIKRRLAPHSSVSKNSARAEYQFPEFLNLDHSEGERVTVDITVTIKLEGSVSSHSQSFSLEFYPYTHKGWEFSRFLM